MPKSKTLPRRRSLFIGGGVFLVTAGTASSVIGYETTHRSVSVVAAPWSYPGFQSWPTPRDFDGPGTLFTLDAGYFEFVRNLQLPVDLAGDESFSDVDSSNSWDGGILGNFAGSASIGLLADSKARLKIKFSLQGAQRWRVDQVAVRHAVENDPALNNPASLYVVTEAISVTGITFFLQKDDLNTGALTGTLGGDQKIQLSANDAADGTVGLNVRYDRPYYVFFRPMEIQKLQGFDNPEILLLEPEAPLSWSRERES